MQKINIIGAGLAGSECALYLANKGYLKVKEVEDEVLFVKNIITKKYQFLLQRLRFVSSAPHTTSAFVLSNVCDMNIVG